MDFLNQFLNNNASAIFGLLGALGGGLISFFASWLLKKRDFNLRLWEKLLERRIKAHDNIVSVAIDMRAMVAWGGIEPDGEVARAPRVMNSRDAFEQWFRHFTQISQEGSTWLTTETKRELNFVQDYLVNLFQLLSNVDSNKYLAIGQVIRQDFIDLSSTLEKKSFAFFKNDVRRLTLSDPEIWHKYKRTITEERLKETALFKQCEKILRIIDSDQKTPPYH